MVRTGIDAETELRARGEQTALPQEPPVLPSAFQAPSSGNGLRRSMKQGGTTGNTKLDLLKSKAASARNSIVSPLNSPQSHTSPWNDTSPTSSILASPVTGQYASSAAALYPPEQPSFPEVPDLQRIPATMPAVHGQHMDYQLATEAEELLPHARNLPLSVDNDDEWHSRFQSQWDTNKRFHSGKLTPLFSPYSPGLCLS